MNSLDLAIARRLADETLTKGRRRALPAVAVAVLDARGVVRMLMAEDEVALLRPDIAVATAWGVLGMGRSSRAMSARAAEVPAFYGALSEMSGGRVVPVPGGVPVVGAHGLMGAVGVNGASSDDDRGVRPGRHHRLRPARRGLSADGTGRTDGDTRSSKSATRRRRIAETPISRQPAHPSASPCRGIAIRRSPSRSSSSVLGTPSPCQARAVPLERSHL